MNFLKRALLAVTRRKGKSVIMFVIFIAIANMVIAGLAIQHATQYASVVARQKLGGQLTLRFDTQSAMQKARAAGQQRSSIQTQPVTEDMAKTIANDKNILNYNYVVNSNGLAQGFTAVAADSQQSDSSQASNNSDQFRARMGQDSNFTMPDVSITGVSATSLLDSFINGQDKMVSGRQITVDDAGKNVAMIEKNLADQNSLKVGDTIQVKATRSDVVAKYTIVGIYQAASTSTSADGGGMRDFSFSQPYNKIYVDYKSAIPLKTVTSSTGTATAGGIDQVVFNVNDPQNIAAVEANAKTMNIDWSKFILDANDSAYKQMMQPIENVASFAMTAVYIVGIAGAIILGLILMLSIKERMYETGVLLSMGEGKIKVIAQYVTEVLLIAVIAFGMSMFTGRIIAQNVGNALLNHEVTVQQQDQSSNTGGGFGRGQRALSNVQAIDTMNIQVSSREIEEMSAAGLIILLAGTILPATTIMRYKPKTILTKMA